jgi:hypothetical protein
MVDIGFSHVFHVCSLFRSVVVVVVSFRLLNDFTVIYISGGCVLLLVDVYLQQTNVAGNVLVTCGLFLQQAVDL